MPEPNLQRQQSVLNLLSNFKGIDPLKKLFWSELNYDRVNQPLSRRGWKEDVANLLADDPVLLASGANDFHVIYGRLASDKLRMGDERPVVSKLLQEHPYALFVFSNSTQEHFHFLNVKYDDDAQKRRVFRRITVGPNERLRTASERIALLDLADIGPELFSLSYLAIQQRNDQAFDAEPVTREFFTEYHRIFTQVEESISGFGRDQERRHLYTQRLFNRLMFIAFIQKKGWLKLNGDADYLTALWKSQVKGNNVSGRNFYRDRLQALFFSGLNLSSEVNQTGINKGAFFKTPIGDVPYLNGGLFEEDEDDRNPAIEVSDKAMDAVLNGLFAKFNFTVTESTPLDVEVAVDPEMLGKIFEELVTGRHESGSYYTPKPIVSFMCREALKGFLESQAAGETRLAIERFVEKHESEDLRNAENILDALRRVRVCDPACGSGAYLLGMLHELLDLRQALFQSRKLDAKTVYERKLEIIQTNVYGIDIDTFAVNIARLRLWLSLAVDFDGPQPEPLPNLDYKVEVGDSLIGPNPSGGLEMGFDIVIGNPPYVSGKNALQTLGREYKDLLSRQYNSAVGLYDLYVLFWEAGLRLISKTGVVAFITPNKIMVADYASAIRRMLAGHTIQSFADVSDLCPFEAASVYPIILVVRGGQVTPDHATHFYVDLQSLDQMVAANRKEVSQSSVFSAQGRVWAVRPAHSSGGKYTTLGEVAKVHGGITGFSAQGLLNAITEGKRTKTAIPFIVTGNIDPYCCTFGAVRYMNHSFQEPFLKPDFDCVSHGKWDLFLKEKIVIAGMSKRIEAMILADPVAVGVAVYSVTDWTVDHYFLLGVLNSDVVSRWYRQEFRAKHLAGGFLAINKGQLEQILIPVVDPGTQQEIGSMVKGYLENRSGGQSEELRKKIEESITKLYSDGEA